MKNLILISFLFTAILGCKKKEITENKGNIEVTVAAHLTNAKYGSAFLYKKTGSSWDADYGVKIRQARIAEILSGVPSTEVFYTYSKKFDSNGKAVINDVQLGEYYLYVSLEEPLMYAIKTVNIVATTTISERKEFPLVGSFEVEW